MGRASRFCGVSILLFFSGACAGPTTPIGAIWSLWKTPDRKPMAEAASVQEILQPDSPSIRFLPNRQVLHGRSDLKIEIRDPKGVPESYEIQAWYNGVDVSRNFLLQAQTQLLDGGKRLLLKVSDVRTQAAVDNRIEIVYRRSPIEFGTVAEFMPPSCNAYRASAVQSTGGFNVPSELLDQIHRFAQEEGMNPTYVAAMLAQESGFNNKAVSWRRALGIAQITPIAEAEIIKGHPEWPRYPEINSMQIPILKWMVLNETINGQNEWRLNHQFATKGALTYLGMIRDYWRDPEVFQMIQTGFPDPEYTIGQLVTASYHSGPARIKRTLARYGTDWLRAPNIRDARQYVEQVFSYCQHFSEAEVSDANPS